MIITAWIQASTVGVLKCTIQHTGNTLVILKAVAPTIFTGTFEVSFANSAIHFSLQGFEWQSAGVKPSRLKIVVIIIY